jgi:hypothetical protein
MNNPIQKNNLFTTPASTDELVDYVLNIPNAQQRQTAMTVLGMTWNLASEIVDQAIINEANREEDAEDTVDSQ